MPRPHTLLWRQLRTSTAVMIGIVLLSIEIGIRAYAVSGGARGMIAIAPLLQNPAVAALEGRISSLASAGAFVEWKMATFLLLAVSTWGAISATRITRLAEDEGTWDQLVLGTTSRAAVLWQAVAVLAEAGLLLGVAAGALFVASGARVVDTLLFALSLVAALWTGAALGLVSAQLVAPRRVASQVASSVVMAMELIRIAADASAHTLGWRNASFFGWIEDAGAFDHHHPFAFLPALGVPLVLATVAWGLQGRRDVGRALWVHGDERRPATRLLGSPLTFALRERRTNWQVWTAGFVLLSFVVGYLTHALITLASTDPKFVALLDRWGFSAMIRGIGFVAGTGTQFSFALAMFVVAWVTQLATDELSGRLDTPFASGARRSTWLLGVIVTGTVAVLLTALVTAGVLWLGVEASGSVLAFSSILEALGSALTLLPFVIGLCVALCAWFPRGAFATATGLLSTGFLLALLGPVLHWPHWLVGLSPFHYLRMVPLQSPDWSGLAVLNGVGLVVGLAAALTFTRRDLRG